MKERIRIGIVINDYNIPSWSYKMIEEINASPNLEIVLTLINKHKKITNAGLPGRIAAAVDGKLFSLWCKLDKIFYKCSPDATAPRNINDLVCAETLEIDQENSGSPDRKNNAVPEQIKKYNLDILIETGFSPATTRINKMARFGILSIHNSEHTPELAGVREVLERRSETEVILQLLSANDKTSILHKCTFATDRESISRNRNTYYSKAILLILSEIQAIYELGEEAFFKKIESSDQHPVFNSGKAYEIPSNREMLLMMPELLFERIKNKVERTLYFDQWIILFELNHGRSHPITFSQFKKIIPPKNKFWADPHVIKRNGKYYIFIEELNYAQNKGYISVIEMDEQGNYTDPVKVLERDYHLSYPFLIEDHGELYMIPESKQNRTIELYKCTNFPLKWELEIVLMHNIKAVDSTILLKDNKYWLFCNITKSQLATAPEELSLFFSDVLITDKWISHRQNPIGTDIRTSRPAGQFFTYNNKLYRPSQDSFKHYGHGLKINHVVELTETSYKEEVADAIYPDWNDKMISTHTINSVDNLTVIDAQIRRRK